MLLEQFLAGLGGGVQQLRVVAVVARDALGLGGVTRAAGDRGDLEDRGGRGCQRAHGREDAGQGAEHRDGGEAGRQARFGSGGLGGGGGAGLHLLAADGVPDQGVDFAAQATTLVEGAVELPGGEGFGCGHHGVAAGTDGCGEAVQRLERGGTAAVDGSGNAGDQGEGRSGADERGQLSVGTLLERVGRAELESRDVGAQHPGLALQEVLGGAPGDAREPTPAPVDAVPDPVTVDRHTEQMAAAVGGRAGLQRPSPSRRTDGRGRGSRAAAAGTRPRMAV